MFFQIQHICINTWYLFSSFWFTSFTLYDSLDPSTSLQITQFRSFIWLTDIPLYICVASLTQWTWVWVSSRSWQWTGKPGMLQSMRSQRVTQQWLNWLTDYIFFIHSSVDEHLGYVYLLAIVNSALLNIGVHVSFWIMLLSGYMPSSGASGSHGSSIFVFG